MPNQKVKVTAVLTHERTYGKQDYAIFQCLTSKNEDIQVAVSHKLLKDRSVEVALLDSFVDSTLIIQDDVDINTGVVTSAEDRVQQILDGTLINPRTGKPSTVILLNGANGNLIKSDIYKAETKDLVSSTNAKISIEKDKARKLEGAMRLAERLKAQKSVVKEETPSTETAVLEENEEL